MKFQSMRPSSRYRGMLSLYIFFLIRGGGGRSNDLTRILLNKVAAFNFRNSSLLTIIIIIVIDQSYVTRV